MRLRHSPELDPDERERPSHEHSATEAQVAAPSRTSRSGRSAHGAEVRWAWRQGRDIGEADNHMSAVGIGAAGGPGPPGTRLLPDGYRSSGLPWLVRSTMGSAGRQVVDSLRCDQHRARPGDRQCAGSFSSWHEQDPSVHLSGFDLAVRFGGFFERQDVGMKVDEACVDGFERAFGGGAGQLGVGREVGPRAEAEDREIGDLLYATSHRPVM